MLGVVSSLNGDGPMISVRRGKHLEQMPASDVFTTLVGNEVWEHFAIILDLKAKKLYIK